jgi:hypothetical protein
VPGKANRATQEQWIREYAQLKSSLQKGETIEPIRKVQDSF